MDTIQAAALNVKLKHLKEWTLKRRSIASEYQCRLKNSKLKFSYEKPNNFHVYHIFSLFCENRLSLQKYLNKNKIGTNFHYPVPAHLQKPYINLGYKKGDFPVTETIANSQISIPIFPEMKKNEIDYVIKIINNF
tara:strand:- start:511 stop:915 length:405 start_codon:yes stop_codon:yes gene_type:complete